MLSALSAHNQRWVLHQQRIAALHQIEVREEIWAYSRGATGRFVRRRATITSRGGASPDRVTIGCDGRKWQGSESTRWGISVYTDGAPKFCRDSARAEVVREERKHRSRKRCSGVAAGMFGGRVISRMPAPTGTTVGAIAGGRHR
jgi:hypothetical protein